MAEALPRRRLRHLPLGQVAPLLDMDTPNASVAHPARLRPVLRDARGGRHRSTARARWCGTRPTSSTRRSSRGWFYTDAISDTAVRSSRSTSEEQGDDPFFLFLVLHRAALAAARARGGRRVRTPAASTPAGTSCARSGWSGSSRRGSSTRRGRSRRATSACRRGRRSSTSEWEASPHGGVRRPGRPDGPGDRPGPRPARGLGRLDNTLVVFLSDNGGCAEEMPPGEGAREFVTAFVPLQETTREGDPVVPGNDPALRPGPESTYMSYGRSWANLSNTPFREYKHWVHEGGIATPFIAHWPAGLPTDGLAVPGPEPARRRAAHHRSTRPVRGYPTQRDGTTCRPWRARACCPRSAASPTSASATSSGSTRATAPYAVAAGSWSGSTAGRGSSTTSRPTAPSWTTWRPAHPDLVATLHEAWQSWADRCGVIPRETVLELYAARGHGLPEE